MTSKSGWRGRSFSLGIADAGALFAHQFPQVAHVPGGGIFGRHANQAAFEHAPRLLQMLELFGFRRQQHPRYVIDTGQHAACRQLVHAAAFAMADGDQAHGVHMLQRFSNGGAAHAKAFH